MALRFVMLKLEVSVTGMILTYFRVEFLIVGMGRKCYWIHWEVFCREAHLPELTLANFSPVGVIRVS